MRSLRWDKQLRTDFDRLRRMRDPHARGRLFERLFLDLAASEGHRARLDSRAAQPRQTDLFVSIGGTDCIVEAKWTKRRCDVGVIDSIRSRLNRLPPDVIGCVLSWSGYTDAAISTIQSDRRREIVAFVGDEIEGIFSEEFSFSRLFDEKRRSLREDARVLFIPSTRSGPNHPDWYLNRTDPFRAVFSESDLYLFGTRADRDVLQTTIPPTGRPYGGGVRLRIASDVDTVDNVASLLDCVASELRVDLERRSAFAIHQMGYSWFGHGKSQFLDQLRQVNRRNQVANLVTLHHSEDAHLRCDDGTTTLFFSLRQRAGGDGIDRVELDVEHPGVPVFIDPYRRIAEAFGDRNCAFELFEKDDYEVATFRLQRALHVERIVLDAEGRWPEAVIARNPFWRKRTPLTMQRRDFGHVGASEHILCVVRYAPPNAAPDEFVLTDVRALCSGDCYTIYYEATWIGDLAAAAQRRKRESRIRTRPRRAK